MTSSASHSIQTRSGSSQAPTAEPTFQEFPFNIELSVPPDAQEVPRPLDPSRLCTAGAWKVALRLLLGAQDYEAGIANLGEQTIIGWGGGWQHIFSALNYKGGAAVVNRQIPPISDISRRIEQNFAIAVILGARRLGGIDATESGFQEHH